MDSEAKATERMKEKYINSKRVAEAGYLIKFRVEAKAEVRDWDVGILTDILNSIKAASNGLKRAMIVSKEETNDKSKRSRAEE